MAVVETERQGAILIVTLNRPERMNALGRELRAGMAEAFTSVYISITFKDAIAFLLLLFVLLVRPSGILGRAEIDKV